MAPVNESANKELKHLNSDVCIVSESAIIDSCIEDWGNPIYDHYRGINVNKYNSIGYLAGGSVEWLFSQPAEETIQENISTSDLPIYVNSNFEKLAARFHDELAKVNSEISIPLKDVENQFFKSSSKVAEIDFADGIVEITRNESIKYTLIFPENKILMISQPLGNQNADYADNEEIIYSFFINRELISTNAMELSAFVEGFNKYLEM